MKKILLLASLFIVLIVGFVLLSNFPQERKIDDIEGLLYTDIIEKYGTPKTSKEFVLENDTYEYRRGLYKYFPEPINERIDILELYWYREYSLYPHFVIWFKKSDDKWVAIEGLMWTRWINF